MILFLVNLTICFTLFTMFKYPENLFHRMAKSLLCTLILSACMHLSATEYETYETYYELKKEDYKPLTVEDRDVYFKRCQFYAILSMRYKDHAREIWNATPTIENTEIFTALMASYLASKTATDLRGKAVTAFVTFSTFILTKATYQIKHVVDNYKLLLIYLQESYKNAYFSYIYQEALFKNCTVARAMYEDSSHVTLSFTNWEICE